MYFAVAFAILLILALIVISIVIVWKLYEKAGEPGWTSIVPIYSGIVFLRIVNRPWWWLFLFFIPPVNVIFLIIVLHRLSRSFGRDAGFTVGVLLFNVIFLAIIAFDNSQYKRLEN